MPTQELIDILRLFRTENIGLRTFHNLIKLYGNASKSVSLIPEIIARGQLKRVINLAPMEKIEQEIESCHKMGAKIISYKDPIYPQELLQINDFPPVLSVFGNTEILTSKKIAIVGSRNSSINAIKFAHKLASDLGQNDYIISSGLARGIDTAAHKGALRKGTIAVIAGGIDHIYPPENKDLYFEIAKNGAIIAELPYGASPKGENFPQRNRIISGMSLAICVIEAALASGSLITARMAIEQNRELFAMPGFPMEPRSVGTNRLIKEGAHILLSAKDVVEQLAHYTLKETNQYSGYNFIYDEEIDQDCLKDARERVISLISSSPSSIEEIAEFSGYNMAMILTIVVELELSGQIERHPNNRISLIL